MTLDEELVRALEEDYTQAPITRADRVMLDYVVQLTKDATRIGPEDHERLRGEGFDDRSYPANDIDRLLVQLHQPGG